MCPVSYSGLSGQKVGVSQSSHQFLVFYLTIELDMGGGEKEREREKEGLRNRMEFKEKVLARHRLGIKDQEKRKSSFLLSND